MKVYSVKEFASLINVCERTLRRWDENGKFPASRLPSGKRVYTQEHYVEYCEKFVDCRKEDVSDKAFQPLAPLKKGRPPEKVREKYDIFSEQKGDSMAENKDN